MDRKAWIIIAICVAILGANIYFSSEKKASEPAKSAQSQKDTAAPSAASPATTSAEPSATVIKPQPSAPAQEFTLQNSRAKFVFSSKGGGIKFVEVNGQNEYYSDQPFRVNSPSSVGIGTIVSEISPSATPSIDRANYTKVDAASNANTLVLIGQLQNGLIVRKTYSLLPTSGINSLTNKEYPEGNAFMLKLDITFENPTQSTIRQSSLGVAAGTAAPVHKGEDAFYTNYFYRADGSFHSNAPSHFKGGMFSSSKSREIHTDRNLEYAGVMNQFFAALVIPSGSTKPETVYAEPSLVKVPGRDGEAEADGVMVAVGIPVIDLAPKASTSFTYDLFIGPKLNAMLSDIPVGRTGWFRDIMAYGWLTFLSVPLNWLLNLMHSWLGNWGLAIIGMTMVVRIIIWPLHNKSYRSMKRMAQMQPKVAELKKKFGNDPQKLNMETMALYKKYGVNPISGCLPMLIQIPIFFAFYRVLQYSTEMRGQPFFGWVHDLSRPDTVYAFDLPFSIPFIGAHIPINILPIIMAVTMILQMRMTPQTGDKLQQRILNLMPLMFFFFCYNFASALALYWSVQNIISMGQTLLMKKLPEPKLNESTKARKPGLLARFIEKQQALMEQQQASQKPGNASMRNITPKKKD